MKKWILLLSVGIIFAVLGNSHSNDKVAPTLFGIDVIGLPQTSYLFCTADDIPVHSPHPCKLENSFSSSPLLLPSYNDLPLGFEEKTVILAAVIPSWYARLNSFEGSIFLLLADRNEQVVPQLVEILSAQFTLATFEEFAAGKDSAYAEEWLAEQIEKAKRDIRYSPPMWKLWKFQYQGDRWYVRFNNDKKLYLLSIGKEGSFEKLSMLEEDIYSSLRSAW